MSKKSQPVNMPKKKTNHVGTISVNNLFMNRAGKLNLGSNPELRSKVHKSKKAYDRNKQKEKLRSYDDHSF